jgi:hypothetical protein
MTGGNKYYRHNGVQLKFYNLFLGMAQGLKIKS